MFLLHDLHGYEHNEIAEILACSVGNSKSQVHKARKRLREVLRKVDRHSPRTGNLTHQRPLAIASEFSAPIVGAGLTPPGHCVLPRLSREA